MTENPNATFTTKDNGALWVQPGGPNTKVYYLGCHDLGDISAPQGGLTLLQCFDGKGGWKTVGSTAEPPAPITTNIGTYLGGQADWLEKLTCPAPFYVLLRDCGKPDLFANRVRALILDVQRLSSINYTGLVNKSEDQPSMVNVDIEAAPPLISTYTVTAVRQAIAETTDLHGVAVCNEDRCAGPCGGRETAGDDLIVTGEALGASPANKGEAWVSSDGGGTWAAAAAQPFAGGEDLGPVVCFPYGRTTTRQIVARFETDAGNPAEVAISDDNGATWSQVNVGSVNGQFAADSDALFALDATHIWLVTTGGYIYFSDDGGETWTAQEDGQITTSNLRAVAFQKDGLIGFAVGVANVTLKTIDGGLNWSAVTGPAVGVVLNTVAVTEDGHVWIGAANGNLYYSHDYGVTWTQRAFTNDGAGEVASVKFANRYVGYMISNTAAPVGTIHRTINGGYTWEPLTAIPNAGLNGLAVANPNLAYVVGNVSTTSVVLKVSGG